MSHTTLPEGLLELLASLYPVAQTVTAFEPITEGYLGRNFALETPNRKLFLKGYRKTDRSKIEAVHTAKIFFATRGIPIILPYVNEEKTTIFEYEGTLYALFPFVEGRSIRRSDRTPKAWSSTGSMLARIHLAGRSDYADIAVPKLKHWDRETLLEKAAKIEEQIRAQDTQTDYDRLALKCVRLRQGLAKLNPIGPDQLGLVDDHLLHGDFHGHNIFYNDEDEVSHVFDLEKACIGPRAFEVARAVDFMCFAPHFNEDGYEFAQLFLQAYNALYPLPKDELARGIMSYYLKAVHALWPESEHYFANSTRTDGLQEAELRRMEFYSEHLETYIDRLTSLY